MNRSEIGGAIVSRETNEALLVFYDLLLKWTPKINLISKSSVLDAWSRHIWDSAQLVPLTKKVTHWVDVGSGGGFPGIIVAIFAKDIDPKRRVTLVESDQRKCAFLRTAIRDLNLNGEVIAARIEEIPPMNAEILSARALADLDTLLSFCDRHLAENGKALFLKGETWEKEVQTARESWSFSLKAHKSITNPGASILEIEEIQRV